MLGLYITAMQAVLPVVILVAVLAVLAVLFLGVFSMARGGVEEARRSNRLMRLRVLLQFVALALIALALFLSGR